MDPTPKPADPVPQANGNHDVARLAALVRSLQGECAELRASLAKAESERDLYLKAVYEHARKSFAFGDLDLDELRRTSAGPVTLLP